MKKTNWLPIVCHQRSSIACVLPFRAVSVKEKAYLPDYCKVLDRDYWNKKQSLSSIIWFNGGFYIILVYFELILGQFLKKCFLCPFLFGQYFHFSFFYRHNEQRSEYLSWKTAEWISACLQSHWNDKRRAILNVENTQGWFKRGLFFLHSYHQYLYHCTDNRCWIAL